MVTAPLRVKKHFRFTIRCIYIIPELPQANKGGESAYTQEMGKKQRDLEGTLEKPEAGPG
jgi:hypothetical protein